MDNKRREFLTASAAAAAVSAALSAPSTPVSAQVADPSTSSASAAPAGRYHAGAGSRKLDFVNLRDLESMAEKVIPKGGFDYIRGGAGDEWTLNENLAAFTRVAIDPHYLAGIKNPDPSITLLGSPLSLPVITPPMGGHRLAHEDGEVATASGTAMAGSLIAVSSVSNIAMEQVMQASSGPKWFQIYFPEDRGFARELLQRAKQSGYRAIIITLDTTTSSNRERDTRNQFRSPSELGHGNMPEVGTGYAASVSTFKHDLNWDDVAFAQRETGLPVILKGVLSPKLAKQAVEHGAAAVIVSNHGGRQLDGVSGTFTALPRVAESVNGRIPVILDGGVRRGQDVFKAIAAGANCVAVGRPVLYGLALGGPLGVQSVYEHLRAELVMTMQLAGAKRIADINKSYLV